MLMKKNLTHTHTHTYASNNRNSINKNEKNQCKYVEYMDTEYSTLGYPMHNQNKNKNKKKTNE